MRIALAGGATLVPLLWSARPSAGFVSCRACRKLTHCWNYRLARQRLGSARSTSKSPKERLGNRVLQKREASRSHSCMNEGVCTVASQQPAVHATTIHRNDFLSPPLFPTKSAATGTSAASGATSSAAAAEQPTAAPPSPPPVLIILNSVSAKQLPGLRQLWACTGLRLCADGGANRLHDHLPEPERGLLVPDVIKGDLDSLRPDVREYYESRGAEVVEAEEQDNNDFEKCLLEAEARLGGGEGGGGGGKINTSGTAGGRGSSADGTAAARTPGKAAGAADASTAAGETAARGGAAAAAGASAVGNSAARSVTVVAWGAFGGRFDQEMAAMHLLHRYAGRFGRLVLVGGGNLAFLLSPGAHHIVPDTRFEGPTCGLLPIGGPCRQVTTKGLRWDLDGATLEFGALVSSSNSVAAETVSVTTDAPLVWTTTLDSDAWNCALGGEQVGEGVPAAAGEEEGGT
ncbi:unnamed protein product [Phaeothamnion confervicola]